MRLVVMCTLTRKVTELCTAYLQFNSHYVTIVLGDVSSDHLSSLVTRFPQSAPRWCSPDINKLSQSFA